LYLHAACQDQTTRAINGKSRQAASSGKQLPVNGCAAVAQARRDRLKAAVAVARQSAK
jgi:hypothetical protein